MIPIPVPIPAEKLLDTVDRLGIVEAVKNKLISRPDPAAATLVTALEEISKIYGAMEDEFTTYLSLFFDDSDLKQLVRERAALARLEAGAIRARMEEARGRCSKITNIYERYLTPWFDLAVSRHEAEELRRLFREMDDFDAHMVDGITELAAWLTTEAAMTSDLVEAGAFAEANARVLSARRQMRPLRERIAEAMIGIRKLESDFIEISRAV
jgi:hypothetical protein